MFLQANRHLISMWCKFVDRFKYTLNWVSYSGVEKSATRASNFSFSLAQLARDHSSRLPSKSVKEQTNTCPGRANLRATCPKGKMNFKCFSSPGILPLI